MSWDLDFLLACTFTILNIIFASAVKGGFLSESEIRFSNLQNKLLQITILNFILKFPPIIVNNIFKFQAQDSDLEYFFFGDLEI